METKTDRINYDVNDLKAIFRGDFEHIQHLHAMGEFKQIFRLRQSTGIIVIEDFINYGEGTNNWRSDHIYHFEQRLLESNPRFQDFKQFLILNNYKGFSKVEIGTLWVISLAMFDELLNMGFADLDRSASANSFAEMVMKYEKNQKRKARRKGAVVDNETGGRKNNVFHSSYMAWIQRLLPWLRRVESIQNQKEALIFIGFLLEASGHSEFKQQYASIKRETRVERKVKSKSRYRDFDIVIEDVPVPYREYLHNRMKTIMKRTEKTVPVPAAFA